MNQLTNVFYGYGFSVKEMDLCTLKEFVLRHCYPELNINISELSRCNSSDDIKHYFDNRFKEEVEPGCGLVLSKIMTHETGIRFYFLAGMKRDEPTIMFLEAQPWQLNDVERLLTEESLKCICTQYLTELGLSAEVDYQRVDYLG